MLVDRKSCLNNIISNIKSFNIVFHWPNINFTNKLSNGFRRDQKTVIIVICFWWVISNQREKVVVIRLIGMFDAILASFVDNLMISILGLQLNKGS